MQGPLLPWQSLERYIKAVLVPHSISRTTSSSLTYRKTIAVFGEKLISVKSYLRSNVVFDDGLSKGWVHGT